MAQTVVGIFDSIEEAQEAVDQLTVNGINQDRVDISYQDQNRRRDTEDDGDGIKNFFKNLFGGDDDRSDSYSEIGRHGCVVTVHAQSPEEAHRASSVLDECGAIDVDDRARQMRDSGQWQQNDTEQTNDRTIPIIQEDLEVGKREVEEGRVRVRSRIVEKPVEEHLRLRTEHVNVVRNPVDRAATAEDLDTFKEGTIEMTEHREVPVVNKTARVVEEVRINKDVRENEETVRDTVRRTDLDIDQDRNTNDRLTSESRDRTRLDEDSDLNNDDKGFYK